MLPQCSLLLLLCALFLLLKNRNLLRSLLIKNYCCFRIPRKNYTVSWTRGPVESAWITRLMQLFYPVHIWLPAVSVLAELIDAPFVVLNSHQRKNSIYHASLLGILRIKYAFFVIKFDFLYENEDFVLMLVMFDQQFS